MVDALVWLLTVEFLGLLAFPFAFLLFHRLPDRGFTVAKPMAMVLASYLLWVLGLTHLAPNSQITIIGILAVGAIISGLILRRNLDRLRTFVKAEWRTLLIAEVVFLGFFLLWVGIRSEVPAIQGEEKPMDFAFLNAVLQSRYFPPEDPWLSGHPISYYYFGHFNMALLTKLTGIASSVSYNLSISLIAALAATGAFGLMHNLVRLSGGSRHAAIGFGLAAPALLLLVGNLEGVLEFVAAQGWGSGSFWDWVGIKGLGACPGGPMWWNASRVIDTLANCQSLDLTINEFPFFSFLLGDLHPHMVSLPFLVLGLSLGLNLFLTTDRLGLGWIRTHPIESGAVALFLGSMAFLNAWDFPLLVAIFSALVLLRSYGQQEGSLQLAAWRSVLLLGPIVLVSIVLFLPFYLTIDGELPLILPVTGPGTRPFLFFLVMGLFSVLVVSLLLRQLPGVVRPSRQEAATVALIMVLVLLPFLIWLAVTLFLISLTDGPSTAFMRVGGRIFWLLLGLAVVGLAGLSAMQRVLHRNEQGITFPLVLAAVAFYLLVGAELFRVVDVFGNRMNTVFKVYYQAWLLLSLVGAYGLYYWYAHPRPVTLSGSSGSSEAPPRRRQPAFRLGGFAWTVVIAALVVGSLYYPVGALLDRTGVLSDRHRFSDNTLDGLAFVRTESQGEYAAIQWLRDEAPWGRIVEAVGDDYSPHGRISASTGLPTVLGWKGHELQWRPGTRLLDGRDEDVVTIYQSRDSQEVRRLLEKYGIRYVYLGRREKVRYGGGRLGDFDGLLRTVFQQNDVLIYEFVRDAN
ncbi:MAG: hypothetical protein IH962_00400 [Chloroflexi bacterium]|nr:hypothetical protein [Chloroflexota bacterium]